MKMTTRAIYRLISLCLLMLAALTSIATQEIAVYPQLGHSDGIDDIAFSPDGKYIASSSQDQTIRLWDAFTGREIKIFNGHAYSIMFSPDGKYFVTGSFDKTIKIRDVNSGNIIWTLSGHSGRIYSVTYSADGKQIVSGSDDKTIKLWDAASGRELKTFTGHTDDVNSIALSSDGKQIVSGSSDETVKLWDVATGKLIKTLSGHSNTVRSVAFSPNGKFIASVSNSDGVKLWDMTSGKESWTYKHPYGDYIAFSPDGKFIACSFNNDIKVLDAVTGNEIRTIIGSDNVGSVAFSPDGKYIASSYYILDYTRSIGNDVVLWDASNGNKIMTFTGYSNIVGSAVYSLDGKYIAFGHGDTIKLWDVDAGKEIRIFSGHIGGVYNIAFSPDGKQIASGSAWETTMRLWDISTGKEIKTFSPSKGGGHTISSIVFSSDGKYIASGYGDMTGTNSVNIILWDVTTGREIKIFTTYSSSTDVIFTPDGKYLVSKSGYLDGEGELNIWDIASGNEIENYFKRFASVSDIAYSNNGKYIVTGSDKNVILWDAVTNNKIKTFVGHSSAVSSVQFSPDSKIIISWDKDKTLRIWNVENGKELITFSRNITYAITSVMVSPNGKRLLFGSYDGSVRLWDIATNKEIARFISIYGSDTQLAAASRGLTVETQTATASNEGEWLSITPDGYYQASPRGDRYLNVRVNNTVSGIDSYRSIFYNPDVVQARLQGKPDPVSKANVTIQQAASFMPPTVTIQSPANFSTTNTTTTNLSINITSQSQPIKNIKIIVNGRLIGKDELAAVKGTGLQSERASLTVTGNQKTVDLSLPLNLDPGSNRIEVVAFNGYSENRRYVDVTRNAPTGEKPALPNLWILAVGVNAYDNAGARLQGLGNLKFCVADAKGIVDSLKAQEGKRYAKVNSLLIADGEAQTPTVANIKQGLKFLEGAAPRDVVVLFLAGHGISAQESKFFFLPKDAVIGANKVVDASLAISGDEIMSVLDAPGNRLVFIDACQSGGVDNDRMVRSLMDTNAFVFTASRGNELSYEDPKLGHGYFTHSVMSALKGAPAALAQGSVSVLSMSGFVQIDVPRLTNDRQHPSAYSLGFYDFPMALIK